MNFTDPHPSHSLPESHDARAGDTPLVDVVELANAGPLSSSLVTASTDVHDRHTSGGLTSLTSQSMGDPQVMPAGEGFGSCGDQTLHAAHRAVVTTGLSSPVGHSSIVAQMQYAYGGFSSPSDQTVGESQQDIVPGVPIPGSAKRPSVPTGVALVRAQAGGSQDPSDAHGGDAAASRTRTSAIRGAATKGPPLMPGPQPQ